MILRLNLDYVMSRWKNTGLLEGIDDYSNQLVMSMFFEKLLQHLTMLTDEEKQLLPDDSETIFFPMLRRLFAANKLPPNYFLSEYEIGNCESYDFFITLSRSIDERNLYEQEIENYAEKHLSLNHRTTVQDDLEVAIKTFIPIMIQNFQEYLNYIKKDLDYMIVVGNCPDPEAEFLADYCDRFNIENLLGIWNERKELEIISVAEFEKTIMTALAKNKLPGSDPIVSTTST